ncbi:unnamed protein product, partial [Choristocarpus tenellus]
SYQSSIYVKASSTHVKRGSMRALVSGVLRFRGGIGLLTNLNRSTQPCTSDAGGTSRREPTPQEIKVKVAASWDASATYVKRFQGDEGV